MCIYSLLSTLKYFKHTRFSSWTHWHTDRFDESLFQNKFFVFRRSEAGQFINLWKSMARKTHWNVQLPQCSEGLFFTLASQATLFIFGIFWQWKLTCRFNGCKQMLIPTIHFILYLPFIRQKIDLMCQNTFLLAKHKAIFCVNPRQNTSIWLPKENILHMGNHHTLIGGSWHSQIFPMKWKWKWLYVYVCTILHL